MQDTQSALDNRNIKISQVGIKDLYHPIFFTDSHKNSHAVSTVGCFSFAVELPATKKGTHMSRFPTLLYDFAPHFTLKKLEDMAHAINTRLDSQVAFLNVDFRFFYEKIAPVSKLKGLTDALVSIQIRAGSTQQTPQDTTTGLTVRVSVKSLCPCSKEISDYGAHNQRSHIWITLWNPSVVGSEASVQSCIEAAEQAASSPLYPVLKRADEKYVTEWAYNNPRFVEDLVREVAVQLTKRLGPQVHFEVRAENFESIHNHNAWALVREPKLC